ncbi:MAG: hypothetical protein AB7P04_00690 [Bacteriovoracia bacterium]
MARKKTAAKTVAEAGLLPVPEPIWTHHAEIIEPLMKQWQTQKRAAPVILLTGPRGIGKRQIVHGLAQWLLCDRAGFLNAGESANGEEGPGLFGDALFAPPPSATSSEPSLKACGECANCKRALDGQWLDFTEIGPEATTEGAAGSIKLDQFDDLKRSQGFGASRGAFKITFIRDAEAMTASAANSLLKLLEEPPPGWIFFLTANDAQLLLPTLVSRCQRVRLTPLPKFALTQLLQTQGVDASRVPICANLAHGSLSKALALAEDTVWEKRTTLFRFLDDPGSQTAELVDWGAESAANLALLLDQWEGVVNDLVQWSVHTQAGQPYAWINVDGQRSLTQCVTRTGATNPAAFRDFWLARARAVAQTRMKMHAPLNRKILVQDLLLPHLGPRG